MEVPLIFSFWFIVAAYVVHVLDESLLGGSFVEKVRQHWWPEYSWTKFFWFNAGYFILMIASVVTYDLLAGVWLLLPLAWSIERFSNGPPPYAPSSPHPRLSMRMNTTFGFPCCAAAENPREITNVQQIVANAKSRFMLLLESILSCLVLRANLRRYR